MSERKPIPSRSVGDPLHFLHLEHLRQVERRVRGVAMQTRFKFCIIVELGSSVELQITVGPELRALDRQQVPHLRKVFS